MSAVSMKNTRAVGSAPYNITWNDLKQVKGAGPGELRDNVLAAAILLQDALNSTELAPISGESLYQHCIRVARSFRIALPSDLRDAIQFRNVIAHQLQVPDPEMAHMRIGAMEEAACAIGAAAMAEKMRTPNVPYQDGVRLDGAYICDARHQNSDQPLWLIRFLANGEICAKYCATGTPSEDVGRGLRGLFNQDESLVWGRFVTRPRVAQVRTVHVDWYRDKNGVEHNAILSEADDGSYLEPTREVIDYWWTDSAIEISIIRFPQWIRIRGRPFDGSSEDGGQLLLKSLRQSRTHELSCIPKETSPGVFETEESVSSGGLAFSKWKHSYWTFLPYRPAKDRGV